MLTPVLSTERLILRPFCEADAEEVYKSWTSDPEVARFMRWSVHESVETTRKWMIEEQEARLSDTLYNWCFVLKESGELIGSGGLGYKKSHGCFELGYNIAKRHWNKGLTTEASKRILRFAKEDLKAEKIFCCHATQNVASGRVIEKLGFEFSAFGSYTSMDGKRNFESKEYYLYL